MNHHVELLYDDDCPNADAARAALREALRLVVLASEWTEGSARPRGYGSPTILVNGHDVAGARPDAAPSCRVYVDADGRFSGVPPVEQIARVLAVPKAGIGWRGIAAALPGFGAALLPALGCPACWPAYAAVVSTLGLGFLLEQAYLLPFAALLLALALVSFGRRALDRHGYGPFFAGSAGATMTLAGKFAFASDALWFLGLVLFVVAAVWNAWPHGKRTAGSCAACAVPEPVRDEQAHQLEVP